MALRLEFIPRKVLHTGKSGGYISVYSATHTDASLKDEGEHCTGEIKREIRHPVWKYHDDNADESASVINSEASKIKEQVKQAPTYNKCSAADSAFCVQFRAIANRSPRHYSTC